MEYEINGKIIEKIFCDDPSPNKVSLTIQLQQIYGATALQCPEVDREHFEDLLGLPYLDSEERDEEEEKLCFCFM